MKNLKRMPEGQGTFKDQEKENLLYELKAITLMPIEDIEAFLKDNKLPLTYLKKWVLAFAKLSTPKQCEALGKIPYEIFDKTLLVIINANNIKPSTTTES